MVAANRLHATFLAIAVIPWLATDATLKRSITMSPPDMSPDSEFAPRRSDHRFKPFKGPSVIVHFVIYQRLDMNHIPSWDTKQSDKLSKSSLNREFIYRRRLPLQNGHWWIRDPTWIYKSYPPLTPYFVVDQSNGALSNFKLSLVIDRLNDKPTISLLSDEERKKKDSNGECVPLKAAAETKPGLIAVIGVTLCAGEGYHLDSDFMKNEMAAPTLVWQKRLFFSGEKTLKLTIHMFAMGLQVSASRPTSNPLDYRTAVHID